MHRSALFVIARASALPLPCRPARPGRAAGVDGRLSGEPADVRRQSGGHCLRGPVRAVHRRYPLRSGGTGGEPDRCRHRHGERRLRQPRTRRRIARAKTGSLLPSIRRHTFRRPLCAPSAATATRQTPTHHPRHHPADQAAIQPRADGPRHAARGEVAIVRTDYGVGQGAGRRATPWRWTSSSASTSSPARPTEIAVS